METRRSKIKNWLMAMMLGAMLCLSAIPVFAESTGTDVNGALSTAMTGAVSQMTSAITTVLPIGLSLMGTVAAIMIGIKVFNKIRSKGTQG